MRQLFCFCDMDIRRVLCGVWGMALANGSGRQQVFQSLPENSLVKNQLSPRPK